MIGKSISHDPHVQDVFTCLKSHRGPNFWFDGDRWWTECYSPLTWLKIWLTREISWRLETAIAVAMAGGGQVLKVLQVWTSCWCVCRSQILSRTNSHWNTMAPTLVEAACNKIMRHGKARNLWIQQCNEIYDGALKSPFYREHLLLFLHTFY